MIFQKNKFSTVKEFFNRVNEKTTFKYRRGSILIPGNHDGVTEIADKIFI